MSFKKKKNVKTVSFKKKKTNEIDEDIDIPEYTPGRIKENFPSLYNELSGDSSAKLSSSDVKELLDTEENDEAINLLDDRNPNEESEPQIKVVTKTKPMEKDYLQGFDPQAIDFIRRAKTEEEALEVLTFLENRGELSADDCQNLKQQLQEQGLESFGDHKPDGYYFEFQQKKHLEEKMKLGGKQPVN